ncbi:MAG: HD domain-containing phosphohydrolase [Campylobacterota bacterium]|nr:HD domain-containing phosphohydrolase [Campylobacterota bacterium]
MFKQTIKTNILLIFLLLIGLIATSLLYSQYYFSHQIAINSTEKTFKLITDNISNKLAKDGKQINDILRVNKTNKDLYKKITLEHNHPALDDLIQMMSINHGIYAIYFAHSDGSFYELMNIKESAKLFDLYKAPPTTRWILKIVADSKLKYMFLDSSNNVISSYMAKNVYNPLGRSWYIDAIKTKGILYTKPYIFSSLKKHGLTYAIELEQKGSVFAIDYTMKRINQFLSLQKFEESSEIFVFDASGKKIAFSDLDSKRVNLALMDSFLQNSKGKVVRYIDGDNSYFTTYKTLKNRDLFLGINVDESNLLKPYIQNLKYSFLIAFLLLLIAIPIIFFATNVIVKPIKALIGENKKIQNRNFKDVANIDTNIIEFIDLSNSFVSMSQSIQEYQKSQEELLDSIVKLIAEAVDAKSPYTGGHCARVPEIAMMLVREASNSNDDAFKDFRLSSEDEIKEFEIGAWLHDCGKVTTPEFVVDKATKLETINNRIHEIRTRFEVLWRDAQIEYMSSQLSGEDKEKSLTILKEKQEKLTDDFSFIASVNIGGEFMDEAKQERIREIASQEWVRNFDDALGLGEIEILRYDKESIQTLPVTEKLLSDKKQHIIKRENFDYASYEKDGFKEKVPTYLYNYGEIYNLCIAKGTLSREERYKIDEHVIMSIKMLEKIPFPAHMSKIPEYAGTHHETLIGTGYPRRLTKDELSVPARIMAIADIFEALTASDRPYKKAKTLSQSIKIMSFMVKDKHIDEDLFKLFLQSGVYKTYAKEYLKPEQIDEIKVEEFI